MFVAVSHIIYQRRSSRSMIAWLLAIFSFPYVATPLYFLVGVRKRPSRWNKAPLGMEMPSAYEKYRTGSDTRISRLLVVHGIPPETSGNAFRLIMDGTEACTLLLEEIARAEQTIEMSSYLFKWDSTTRTILEALTRQAAQGVRVRLMLDRVGSFGMLVRPGAFRALKEAGGDVRFFTPILRHPFQSYLNLRNHRKIFLFDRQRVLSGGMNLSAEYLGCRPDTHRWHDLLFRIEGPAVLPFVAIFREDWAYAGGLDEEKSLFPKIRSVGEETIQVVPSGPDIPEDALYEGLLNAIYGARERIWIVTPYFIPDENIMEALTVALHKGVDVRLITPEVSDVPFVDLARSAYMRPLQQNGARLLWHTGGMLHAKAMMFDHSSVMLGTLNLDNRSLFLNYELVAFISSPRTIKAVEAWMETLGSENAAILPPPSKLREALENIMKVFAPLI